MMDLFDAMKQFRAAYPALFVAILGGASAAAPGDALGDLQDLLEAQRQEVRGELASEIVSVAAERRRIAELLRDQAGRYAGGKVPVNVLSSMATMLEAEAEAVTEELAGLDVAEMVVGVDMGAPGGDRSVEVVVEAPRPEPVPPPVAPAEENVVQRAAGARGLGGEGGFRPAAERADEAASFGKGGRR